MLASDLSHHTSRRFNEDLERVRTKVLTMGGFVEEQLGRCLLALAESDSSIGESVRLDDDKVNGMEVSIDGECSRILAMRTPAAGDLRMVVATIKAITDLERIGDECEKIGQIAARLAGSDRPPSCYRQVLLLGRTVQRLVHDTLDAFARMDAEAALQTCRVDRLVDQQYEAIQRQCVDFMFDDPGMIRSALDIMWVVRALERIGDHAKNVCEDVIYVVHGTDVRHTSLERVERELAEQAAVRRR